MSLVDGVTAAIVGISGRQPHLLGKGRAASLRTPNGIRVTLCGPSG